MHRILTATATQLRPPSTRTYDSVAPTVSIGAPSATITSGGPVTYTVTYADTNFNSSTLVPGNITLNKTGTANGTIGVSGTGLTRIVTISGITGDGTLGISIAAGTASDLAGNTAPAAGPSTTFDISQASSSVTVTCPVSVTYTGSAIEPCTASYSTGDGLSGSLTPTYTGNTNVGTATANASFAGDANHEGSSNSATFEISKVSSAVTVTCPVSETLSLIHI